jgi:poly(3-hydroxybutyrate) depolymerase
MPGGTGGTSGSSGSGLAGAGIGGGGASGAGGMAGAAGSTAGSASGSGGSGGSSGGSSAMPSPGCGKSSGVPMNVNVPNAIVTFPDGYDGSTPVPMMFGFHGAGRTNQDFYMSDARMQNSDLEEHFAMVYLKSAGSAWAASDSSRLDTAYTQMTQNYCIDLKRVFATGHSSGAQFIERRLCDGETRFAAVAPVAGSRTCNSWAALPSLLIHGLNDNQRAGDENGQQERGPFITSNSCSMTTMPYASAMACNSIFNQAAVNNGCVAYDGCSKPFVFCNHNDQNYSSTNHGWPCFANQTMYAFFTSL